MDQIHNVQNPLLELIKEHPYANHHKNQELYRKIFERMDLYRFTPLQEKAFNDEKFWENRQSLMIRGATSSGKTLIAEIAMAQCRRDNKKVIYLAPLRAMVSQKYSDFKNDFSYSSDEKVYASSRDHQINDTQIMQGSYSIAVMVYEKFYALISQKNARDMIEQCGLIVLDELQMIGEPERGMKIIMSLIKAIKICHDIRIIGLSTTYCDVTEIRRWFSEQIKKDLYPIENELNALPLEEMVILYDGRFRGNYVPSAGDVERADWEDIKEIEAEKLQTYTEDVDQLLRMDRIDPPPQRRITFKDEKKRNLLQRIVSINQGRKIIIFCHSRKFCRILAQTLAESSARKPLSPELLKRLENENESKVRNELRDSLLPYGVAYHHGALSHSMRSIIEDAFKNTDTAEDTSRLDILVATETLAIGVNLPADVIIVYDTQKHDYEGKLVAIDEQTYKNYIGRAGRLMRRVDEDFRPRSYLLALEPDDLKSYWIKYINATETTIVPVFKRLREVEAIPYFLSLVSLSDGGNQLDYRQLLNDSMPDVAGVDTFIRLLSGGNNNGAPGNIDMDWNDAQLTAKVFTIQRGREINVITLSDFGGDIVPYALSIGTCATIRYFFVDMYKGGLPADIKRTDIDKNRYLPDILFLVCKMFEINVRFRQIEIANRKSNNQDYYDQRDGIFSFFRERLAETNDVYSADGPYWKDSYLYAAISVDDYKEDTDTLNALLRVAVLIYWTNGGELNKFSQQSGIPYTLEEGDIERLADIASYLLEAIGIGVGTNESNKERTQLRASFLRLANRVKYGCDDECVRILNCHIPGISRQSVLEAERKAKTNGLGQSLYHFIMHSPQMDFIFTRDDIRSLRDSLRAKYGDEMAIVLSSIKREGFLPDGIEELIAKDREQRRDPQPQNMIDFLGIISKQESCPFLFGRESDEREPAVYSASYLNFRLHFLFFPERVTPDYNVRNFISTYDRYLKSRPGHYILVSSGKLDLPWEELNRQYPDCILSGISSDQLFLIYLGALPEVANGINPFLYSLYHSGTGIISTETVSVPDNAYWQPSEKPKYFISYVHSSSQELACKLYDSLTSGTVFLDSIGISPGDSFPSILKEAIRTCDTYFMLYDDIYGTQESPWTKHEIDAISFSYIESGQKKNIIPIILTENGKKNYLDSGLFNDIIFVDGIGKSLEIILSEAKRKITTE